MTKHTLTLRRAIVLVVVSGLIFPAMLVSGYSWFKRYDEEIQKRTQELLQQNAEVLSNGMQEPLWNINTESGTALLDAMMMRNEDIIRIEVRDTALGVFVAGERPERRIGYTASTEKPVTYRGSNIGSIQIEVGSSRLRRLMIDSLLQQVTALGAQIVMSIALILVLLEKRLVSPLQRLGKGADRLASRELDVPFTWQRLDEIGMLSRRLEDTRVSLRNLFEELDHKNQELEQDIDKRKKIEQELHEREARFRALVEQSPIAIIEWDSEYRVLEWNTAAERIFGYSRQQAVGRHGSFITRPIARSGNDKILQKLTSTGGSHSITENVRADGQVIICQWSTTHIDDETGHTGRLLSMAEDITEKRRAEEAQRLSEAKFSGAFQCNPDSVSITRLNDGIFLDVNQTFEKITGYARNEWIGQSALSLNMWLHPEENDVLIGQLNMYKMVRDFPWSMRTKSGEIRSCISNATIFSVGNELYMLAVIRDVTDQRKLEELKSEADRALLRLAQGTQDLAGESFLELLLADLASALRTDRALISLHSAERADQLTTLAAYCDGQAEANFTYSLINSPSAETLDGDICIIPTGLHRHYPNAFPMEGHTWDSYAGAPLRDIDGNPIGELAVMHVGPLSNPDLVRSLLQVFSERASAELERKRAEQALRSSEQRFSTIFQSSPVAMFVMRSDGDRAIRDTNGAFERLFHLERERAIGKSLLMLDMYCQPEDDAILTREFDEEDREQCEIWMYDGQRNKLLIQISGHSFKLSDDAFTIFACQDITDKRRIENEIRELNSTLEQRVIARTDELQTANKELASTLATLNMAQSELVRSEKLAALGSLVAGIAHELNTPIGNSLMVASTLSDQTKVISNAFQAAAGIKRSMLETFLADAGRAGEILVRNLYRAANLVTSFKQVAVDQTSSQRRSFSLAEVIGEIILTLWPTLKKTSFSVEQHIPDTISLDSYPGPLGQVITNLVNNALIHGFEGRDQGTVSLSATQLADDAIEIVVSDTGVGIPAHNLNRIFDPFFTTKLGAGGSGLGLNITHNIVTGILGGRIRVESEVGKGTRFTLTLPVKAPQRQTDDFPIRKKSSEPSTPLHSTPDDHRT